MKEKSSEIIGELTMTEKEKRIADLKASLLAPQVKPAKRLQVED